MTPPGDPDSGRGRAPKRRPTALGDTIDETSPEARAAAAAAVIERDVREGLAVERPEMAAPRARTPAEVELRKTIDELRRGLPEWHVAEQTARALDQNGNGGACGFLMYGSAGQHNNDFSAHTYNFADGLWRMVEIGYHASRKESWLTVAQRRDKTNSPLAVNILHATASGVGDMTNTDSWFLLGGDYWGIRQANQTGGIGLPLVVFEGTPAENRYAVRIAELPVLQAQLEAYEP